MRRPNERGIILIAVLLAVAIMSVMVVAAAALTRASIGNERLEQRRLASHFALRSGLESAKAVILATAPEKRLALLGAEVPLDLGNGVTARATLQDAAGLVDLNRSDPALIEAAVRFAGIPDRKAKGLAEAITKLRKEAEPAATAAAAKAQTAPKAAQRLPGQPAEPGKDPSVPPAPLIFRAPEQFFAYLDLSGADARQLAPSLTIFNPTGAINPLAAPRQVLAAVPGLTERDVSDILAARKAGAGDKDARLQQLVARMKGVLAIGEPTVFVIDLTLDEGPGVLAGSRVRAVVRLVANGPLPFGTLAMEEQ